MQTPLASPTTHYDPTRCGLCDSPRHERLLSHRGRSMTSDSRIVPLDLVKLRCQGCGLVRDGLPHDQTVLDTHYGADYQLARDAAIAEPIFFTADGPRPRSAVIHDWLTAAIAAAAPDWSPTAIAEIGCGEGNLLARLSTRWPDAHCRGLDLHPSSGPSAAARGITVQPGGYNDLHGTWDLIVAFAVLEHVPSPQDFLTTLARRLSPHGLLVIAQPCQDLPSTDLYFRDHLHHFHAHHVTAFAARSGLTELHREVGHRDVGPFSLHVLRPTSAALASSAPPSAVPDAAAATPPDVGHWQRVFARVAHHAAIDGPLAVWGVGQSYTLFTAYAGLDLDRVWLAFDDNPRRFDEADLPFPVMPLEALDEAPEGLRVLLTFPANPAVRSRLEARDLSYLDPFEEDGA